MVTVAACGGCDGRRIRTRIRFGHAEGHMQITGSHSRQVGLLHLLVAVFDDRVHPEYRQMQCAAAIHGGSGRRHFFEHDARFGHAATTTAILFGNGDTNPSRLSHRVVEVPRKLVGFVFFRPILIRKVLADLLHRIANELMFFGNYKIQDASQVGL